MPEIAIMIASVAVVTQLLKVTLAKLSVIITGIYAVVLTALSALGIVAYHAIQTGTQFNSALLWIFIQVAIGAIFGYKVIQGVVGSFQLKDLRGRILND